MRTVSRRRILHAMGASIAAAPLAHLLACGSSDDAAPKGGASSSSGGSSGGAGGTSSSGGGTSNDAGLESSATGWATGGTAAMKGGYPDPFRSGLGNACRLTCSTTLGPCYADTLVRKDVSEGHAGLPTRLAFLVVDESCKPIPNAEVDIWHTAPEGMYSASDVEMCTSGDQAARAARWFRGKQTADANGRVDFDTCFPGWYPGRTIHIHFTVRVGGTEHVTGQLFFDDALSDDVIATQPIYKDRGARDTTNQNDGVVAAADAAAYSFETARMPDGALLAWKAIVLRSSTGSTLCRL